MVSYQYRASMSEDLLRILPIGFRPRELKATVLSTISPYKAGRVSFLGNSWRAICRQEVLIEENAIVRVVDREDLTLVVEPLLVPVRK